MIFEYFITVFGFIANGIISLLPDVQSLPSAIDAAISYYVDYVAKFNSLIPFNELFIAAGITISVEIGIALFSASEWVYNKIRGSG